jgi:type VI protein secretion system component Hcp
VRRSRKQEDELRARELGETGKETAGERSLAGEATRLQELLGNARTTAVLDRSALQRDTTTEAAPAKNEAEARKGSSYVMTMSNGIGTFDLESVSFGGPGSAPEGPGSGDREEEPRKFNDLHATKKTDAASPKLMEFARDGKTIDEVKVVLARDGKPYLTITIKNAVISSFSTSGSSGEPFESFSLNFTEVEYDYKPVE